MKGITRRGFAKRTAVAGATLAMPNIARGQSKKYRVAVIGRTGRGDYGHGLDEVWKEIDQVEIVALADEDAKGRALTAKKLAVDKTYANYREMLKKVRPQIVSVAPRWIDCHHGAS